MPAGARSQQATSTPCSRTNTSSRTRPGAIVRTGWTDNARAGEAVKVDVAIVDGAVQRPLHVSGNGAIYAFVDALGLDIRLMDYHEHAIGSGADGRAACHEGLCVPRRDAVT
jgi:2-isopropylmalate synthase